MQVEQTYRLLSLPASTETNPCTDTHHQITETPTSVADSKLKHRVPSFGDIGRRNPSIWRRLKPIEAPRRGPKSAKKEWWLRRKHTPTSEAHVVPEVVVSDPSQTTELCTLRSTKGGTLINTSFFLNLVNTEALHQLTAFYKCSLTNQRQLKPT